MVRLGFEPGPQERQYRQRIEDAEESIELWWPKILVKLVHFETFSKDVFNELQIVLKFEPLKNLVTHIFG